ncbi:hypothetical protein T492DRAFT_903413 [Pavlovales sp. CCMP2436]|nr:hypothetical protein T492DRAFT_903413 [Pavlovales sp. CCMP2436]
MSLHNLAQQKAQRRDTLAATQAQKDAAKAQREQRKQDEAAKLAELESKHVLCFTVCACGVAPCEVAKAKCCPTRIDGEMKARRCITMLILCSDAAKLLESHGLADISDPVVLQQMLTKHPRRRTAMPPVIPGLDATDRLVVGILEMQESYRGLKTDRAQGALCGQSASRVR